MTDNPVKREAMTQALVGSPDDLGPFLGDDEAAGHWAAGVIRRYEGVLAAAGYSVLTLPPHPFTCGTCDWEGPTRDGYLAHVVEARHDHYDRVLAAR